MMGWSAPLPQLHLLAVHRLPPRSCARWAGQLLCLTCAHWLGKDCLQEAVHVGLVGAVAVGQGAQAQEVPIVQEGSARCLAAVTPSPANLKACTRGVRRLQTAGHD